MEWGCGIWYEQWTKGELDFVVVVVSVLVCDIFLIEMNCLEKWVGWVLFKGVGGLVLVVVWDIVNGLEFELL